MATLHEVHVHKLMIFVPFILLVYNIITQRGLLAVLRQIL